LNKECTSTLTTAIVDLFFGIGQRSPYDFLHGYDTMRIGAALDLPSGTREVVRVRRGARLRDASGQAIDEGILTAGLSGINRDAYPRSRAVHSVWSSVGLTTRAPS